MLSMTAKVILGTSAAHFLVSNDRSDIVVPSNRRYRCERGPSTCLFWYVKSEKLLKCARVAQW